jgi:CheY-like chemotaxis protein
VLFNLLKNALYYLPRHPDMRVTITVDLHQIRVRDTGPGIPREALAHLFEPFKSAGKSGGTGLGLAYCDRVMRGFGGSIDCESVLGNYTEFTLRFPPVDEEEVRTRQAAAIEAVLPAFAGKRILLVDDDAMQRLSTRRKLAALPAAVDEAAGGQEALEFAFRRRYDLVLLDLNMPAPDGCAVARKLRAGHGATPASVPIVAYTAEPAQLAAARAGGAGVDGFVPKPSTPLALLQALRDALEQPRGGGAALDGCAVLLVDDADWNRKAVAGYLRQAGVAVTQAAHGEEALQKLREGGAWDAVIMDIQMPGMDGVEATRAIRAAGGAYGAVPVIGLTAHSDAVLLDAARAAGMNDFITKPVDPGRLMRMLRRLARAGGGAADGGPPPARTESGQKALLDAERLETYRRIGLFDDLLTDYLPAMERVIDDLEAGAAQRDMEACLQALHKLLGMSGEAGATALQQLVRRLYVPMLEQGRWPEDEDWARQVRQLAYRTDAALRTYST